MTSRHKIRNSSPGGLRPSTLPLGHRGSPQYLIFTSERRRNIVFPWNLNARAGFEPASSDFPSRQLKNCTRAPSLEYYHWFFIVYTYMSKLYVTIRISFFYLFMKLWWFYKRYILFLLNAYHVNLFYIYFEICSRQKVNHVLKNANIISIILSISLLLKHIIHKHLSRTMRWCGLKVQLVC